ncbi:MAG TPA: hypothetical protein VH496_18600 [Mycobacterium sp.]|jgi:hypothetical protein
MGLRRIVLAAAVGTAVIMPAVAAPSRVSHLADCPDAQAQKKAGYACVNPNPVGAPSQNVVTRCGGNYYICTWPYSKPGTP